MASPLGRSGVLQDSCRLLLRAILLQLAAIFSPKPVIILFYLVLKARPKQLKNREPELHLCYGTLSME